MKQTRTRVLVRVVAALTLFLLGAMPALAQSSPAAFFCGKVTSYTAPTATTEGSIGIGTTTFVLRAGSISPGSSPPPVAVGSVTCVDGRRDASGAFTSFGITLTDDGRICGPVTAFTPASAASRGSITLAIGQISPTLLVRAGVSLSSAQTTGGQCFKWAVSSADGNAEVVSHVGPFASAPAPGQLPSTSTSGSDPAGPLVMVIVGVLVLASATRRRAGAQRG